MGQFGFIHDKLEIKFLILFILGRLEGPVDPDTITDITLFSDEGIGYFSVAECLADLMETAHVQEENGQIIITEKGQRNGRATESSIPYSVRKRAEQKTTVLARVQRRNAMVKAERAPRAGGGYTVTLSLSDGLGEILAMELYAASETQAAAIQNGFQQRAEQLYGEIISLLVDEQA